VVSLLLRVRYRQGLLESTCLEEYLNIKKSVVADVRRQRIALSTGPT
jgi:hypothetical protein